MITRETDYAIRTILYLSRRNNDTVVSTKILSEQMLIPYRFLRRIVKQLVENGLVSSRKGHGGGIRLLKQPEEISVYDICQIFGKPGVTLNQCLTDKGKCEFLDTCTVHTKLEEIQEELDRRLQSVTFSQLA